MKLSVFMILIGMLQVSANVYSQAGKLNVQVSQVALSDLLWDLQENSGVVFVYKTKDLADFPKISIDKREASITEILDELLFDTDLEYTLDNGVVIIKKKLPEVIDIKPEVFKEQKDQKLKGTVTDEDGNSLPGVSVVVKGTTNGVATDINGNYSINLEGNNTVLVFSFVGMISQEIVFNSQTKIDVVLKSDSKKVDEVVVTGYRNISINEFTGSVGRVKVAELKKGGETSIDKMLQGKIAGVSIEMPSSVFGAAPKVRIRGTSSITGINEPLWVLDGVVLTNPVNINPSELFSGNARTLLSSALSGVNPEDIADINILKDATATALYGTKAVNGVIVITTKRGKKEQPLQVSYSNLFTLNAKPSIRDFDVLDSNQETIIHDQLYNLYQAKILDFSAKNQGAYAQLLDLRNRKELSEAEYLQRLRSIKSVNTDWMNELFRNSLTQQHNLSASFGSKRSASRVSFSTYNDNGYSIGQNVSRYTVNVSNKLFLTDKFSAEALVKYANRKQKNPSSRVNPFSYALTTSRAMRPYDDDGNLQYYSKDYAPFNIIDEINNDYVETKTQDVSLQLQLDYRPLDNLKLTLLGNKATSISEIRESTTENSSYANSFRTDRFAIIQRNDRLFKDPSQSPNELPKSVLPKGGILQNTNIRTTTNTFRLQADYTPIENDDQKLNIFLGSEITKYSSEEIYFKGFGYIFESGTAFPNSLALIQNIDNSESGSYYKTEIFMKNQLSFYANINYSFRECYTLTASLRNDATNVSGTASRNKFLPTWVIGAGWLVSNENFMENIKIITNIKLRGSYGLRGNAGRRGPDLVAYYNNYARLYPKYNELGINVSEPQNDNLEWEKEYIISAGLDFSLFNKLNFTVEYYNRKNFDLLGYRPVLPSSGYSNKVLNWAVMRNEGLELSVDLQSLNLTKDLILSANFNIGYNKNTILSNYIGNNPTVYTASRNSGYPFKGKGITGMYSFKFAGLDANGLEQYYNAEGNKVYGFKDQEKNYGVLSYQGSRDPLYSGGFNTKLSYKGFDLGVVFNFNLGHVIRKRDHYKSDDLSALFRDDYNIPGDFKDRWQAPGNEKYTQIPRLLDVYDEDFYAKEGIFDSHYASYNRTDIRTVDASYLRLKNVFLDYTFPKKVVEKLRLKNLSIGIQATNLAVFASKRLRGMDPEFIQQGINIPPVSSFSLNMKMAF